MTDIQKHILMMLKEVDDICRRNGIEYYMEGGSALGAVRHGGFLPWDDDSDLAMTRDNWEAFRAAFERERPVGRALESPEINENYPTNTARYMDTTTTNIWRSLMYDVCANGCAVDIFILEDAPDDDELLEQQERDMIDYCEFICPYYRFGPLGDGKRYRKNLRRAKLLGRRRVARELNERVMKYHGTGTGRYLMRWAARFQVYDKALFGKPRYVPFEDTWLPVPERIYEYLSYQFGVDWYMIPQVEDFGFHDTVRDLDIPYENYVRAYMPLINKEKALRINRKYKESDMRFLDYNKAYHRHIYSVAGNAAAELLLRRIEADKLDYERAFSAVTPEADALFEDYFGDYLYKQLYEWYIFYGVYIPVGDDLFACVAEYLFRSGEYRKTSKLLELRLAQKEALSPRLQRVKDSYDLFIRSTSLFWDDHLEDALKLMDENEAICLPAPITTAVRMFGRLETADDTALEELRRECERCLALHSGEELFKLLYAHILFRQGHNASAARVVREIRENSRHGMVRFMLQKNGELSSLAEE